MASSHTWAALPQPWGLVGEPAGFGGGQRMNSGGMDGKPSSLNRPAMTSAARSLTPTLRSKGPGGATWKT